MSEQAHVWVVQRFEVRPGGYADDVLAVFSTEEGAETYANTENAKDDHSVVEVLLFVLDDPR